MYSPVLARLLFLWGSERFPLLGQSQLCDRSEIFLWSSWDWHPPGRIGLPWQEVLEMEWQAEAFEVLLVAQEWMVLEAPGWGISFVLELGEMVNGVCSIRE